MSGELKAKALRLLARREHSRAELARKLSAEPAADSLDAVLDQLEAAGLLSDRRYAESLVAARSARYGSARLRQDLRSRGIADEIIAAALSGEAGDEFARARHIWQRKFGRMPADRADYARQTRFLQGRGFAGDVIRQVLKGKDA
ncbi:MAG TPA: recombination regulator RecX [Candidatus Desulfobacillus sp.]|nr:recombination regulator RecX [Candidatus Desulfobacillus sp.]